VAHHRQEGAFRFVGGVCFHARAAGFCVERRVAQRAAHVRGEGIQQAHIAFGEDAFLVGALDAQHAHSFGFHNDRHAEVGAGQRTNQAGAHRFGLLVDVLVKQERLTARDDFACQSFAFADWVEGLAVGIREVNGAVCFVEQSDVGDIRLENAPELFAN